MKQSISQGFSNLSFKESNFGPISIRTVPKPIKDTNKIKYDLLP